MSDAPSRLRLVSEAPANVTDDRDLAGEIRATRRSVARFLRALHASGHAITAWPDALVSRLAHADAVTARYLVEPGRVDSAEASAAAAALRSIAASITSGLAASERAELRACELAIRIEAHELTLPLLQIERAPAIATAIPTQATSRHGSLRALLAAQDDVALGEIARRLGLAHKTEPAPRRLALVVARSEANDGTTPSRRELEHDIARVLRDEHLLAILLATLGSDAIALLATLVRGTCSEQTLQAMSPALAVGGPRPVGPADALVRCGLVFHATHGLAVPDDLRTRLDGVLQTLGT
ncbi:MAG TPA: hypothetical protein VG755_34265 [Nannocystaceae bacterium]|nr:hypothetical protein [Nannocystaceae bacterium]